MMAGSKRPIEAEIRILIFNLKYQYPVFSPEPGSSPSEKYDFTVWKQNLIILLYTKGKDPVYKVVLGHGGKTGSSVQIIMKHLILKK